MTLRLSSEDRRRFRQAATSLLTPLAFESLSAWRLAAATDVARFIGADHGTSILPQDAAAPMISATLDTDVLADFTRRYAALDRGLPRLIEQGRVVWATELLWRPEEVRGSPYWHEFRIPNRILSTIGIRVIERPLSVGPSRAPATPTLLLTHERVAAMDAIRRKVALLELLHPALAAGADLALQLHLGHGAFAERLEQREQAGMLVDGTGRVLYETGALRALLAADAGADGIRADLVRFALALWHAAAHGEPLGPGDPHGHSIETPRARYRVDACAFQDGLAPPPGVMAVVVRRLTPVASDDQVLRERFGLTRRECDVARLLARGLRNAEIAARLGISPHTAERHTERVLAKLHVATRAAVAGRLAAGDDD